MGQVFLWTRVEIDENIFDYIAAVGLQRLHVRVGPLLVYSYHTRFKQHVSIYNAQRLYCHNILNISTVT